MSLRKWYKAFYMSRLGRSLCKMEEGQKTLSNADIASQVVNTANTKLIHNAGSFYDEALKSPKLIEIYVHR